VKHPVKTLAALALLGLSVPSAFSASIKEDAGSLTFKTTIQARAYALNDATQNDGSDWDPLRGLPGEAEAIRFDSRRVRFAVVGKYGDWSGNVTIRGDKSDKEQNGGASGGNGRPIQLYYAKIERNFKIDETLSTSIRFGLDKSFNNDSSYSSSNFVLPGDSIVGERDEERSYGIGWMLRGSWFNLGADLHNNNTGVIDGDAHDAAGPNAKNGLFYSARFEFAPGSEYMIAKKMQSFVGKEGTGLMLGINAQWDDGVIANNVLVAGGVAGVNDNLFTQSDVFTWGPDILFHWNGLTTGAEYRIRETDSETGNDVTGVVTQNAGVDGEFWDAWIAYAMPVSSIVIEPVIRYGIVDNNKNVDAVTPYNTGSIGNGLDNGGDGSTLDLGVNFYFDGHNNKLLVNFQHWKAESGNADANIIRIQQQFEF